MTVRPVERLLPLLEGVREVGRGRFIARCPAHDDGRPSLSIRECEDGRLLTHCFAGCPVGDVVAAVGFELRDLFPPDPTWLPAASTAPKRTANGRVPRIPAGDALQCLALDAHVVEIVAYKIAAGEGVTAGMLADVRNAARRIRAIELDWSLA